MKILTALAPILLLILLLDDASAQNIACNERQDGSSSCLDYNTGEFFEISPTRRGRSRDTYSVDRYDGGYSGTVTVDRYERPRYQPYPGVDVPYSYELDNDTMRRIP